jgi:hypothetical protein
MVQCKIQWRRPESKVTSGELPRHQSDCQNLEKRIAAVIGLHFCNVRFEVFTAVIMKNGVFWVVTPCGSCKRYFFAAYVGC